MGDSKKVLLVRLSSVGDVVLALPACYSLKRAFPSFKVHWVCESNVKDLLELCDFIDRVIEFPKIEILFFLREKRYGRAGELLKNFIRELRNEDYDVTVDLHGNLKSALISSFAKSRRLIGFSRPYAKEASFLLYKERVTGPPIIHKTERFLLPMKYLGVNGEIREFDIPLKRDDLDYVERFLESENIKGPLVAINPFSSRKGMYKRWPMEYYRILVEMILSQSPLNVLILWGNKDEKKEAESLLRFFSGRVYLSCETKISQLLALLRKVDIHIGGDTASSHLCALLKKPQIVIFGPSDHRVNAPIGKNTWILRKDVGCNPCKVRDCKDRKCLNSIRPKEVFERLISLLEGTA